MHALFCFVVAEINPYSVFKNLTIYVCMYSKQIIGWRANARHVLLYLTDAGFHFAGDGKVCNIL